jgi:hypothetical protein
MKPGPNYKMSRAAKTVLANSWNRPNRGAIRRAVIQGELYGKAIIKSRKDN